MKVICELRKRNKRINRIKSFEDWNKQISNRIKKLKIFKNQILKEIEETTKIIELVISKKLRKKQSEDFFNNKIIIYQSIEALIQKIENEQKSALKRHEDRGKKDDDSINNNYWKEIRKAYRAWKAFKEKGDYILIATDNNNYCYKYSDYELQQAQSRIRRREGGIVVVNIGGKLILVASAKKKTYKEN